MISPDDWKKDQSGVSDDELDAATGGVGSQKRRKEKQRPELERSKRKGHEYGDYIDP